MSEEKQPYTVPTIAATVNGTKSNEVVDSLLTALDCANETIKTLARAFANAVEQRNLALAEVERLSDEIERLKRTGA